MQTTYFPMYIQPWPTEDGSLQMQAVAGMRFDFEMRAALGNLHCGLADGSPNPAAPVLTFTIVEPYGGCFAIIRLDASPDDWVSRWRGVHLNRGALSDEAFNGATRAGATTRLKALRTQYRAAMDALNVPAAATDSQRLANYLIGLNLQGHHPGFEVLRQCYVNSLTDPPTLERPVKMHHWMLRPEFYDGSNKNGLPIKRSMLVDLKAEMDAVPISNPIRLMHVAQGAAEIALYLESRGL